MEGCMVGYMEGYTKGILGEIDRGIETNIN
jgi:hypothetical protein